LGSQATRRGVPAPAALERLREYLRHDASEADVAVAFAGGGAAALLRRVEDCAAAAARGAVAARLATLKTETADDVLAKLRGPRRARGDRAPAPGPASPAAAPSSAAAGGGELLARLERKRGRRRKATR